MDKDRELSPMAERIRVREVRVLSDDWYLLKKTTLDYQRRDGSWQTLNRETYDRGNGAAILLYDPARGTVLLVRQFRYPAFVNGHPEPLIEVAAGLLDELSPEEAIRRDIDFEPARRRDSAGGAAPLGGHGHALGASRLLPFHAPQLRALPGPPDGARALDFPPALPQP